MTTNVLQSELAEPVVPHWLRRHAETWIKIPEVEAVVLFGSRANGSANENSDWDVAIVHGDPKPTEIPMDRDFSIQQVDVPLLSLRKFVEESHYVGTLAHELAVNGKVLAGSVPPFDKRRLAVSKWNLARHVEFAFHGLAMAIVEVDVDMSHGDPHDSLDLIPANYSSAPSANGAERLAKALCVHLGVTYRHTHNARELAELVPQPWRKKVLETESVLPRAYSTEDERSTESVADVAKRITVSFDLLHEILPPICNQLSTELLVDLDVKIASFAGVKISLDLARSEGAHPTVAELADKMEIVRGLLRENQISRESKRDCDQQT